MQISIVIPTCNRKASLLQVLQSLSASSYPLREIIVVDSGEERLAATELELFSRFPVRYLFSEKSVCIQRNIGIREAKSEWVFLCDDDVEMPADYIGKLAAHAEKYNAGAVSGQWLQKQDNGWQASWPELSSFRLLWKYIFGLSVWGAIKCGPAWLKRCYNRKGNHITKAGWPVITQMSGEFYITPVYTLGASLVKRDWLLQSPFDEVLDRNGIGDNYGVAMGFPEMGIHIVHDALVYHHRAPVNRLKRSLQYYRRALALDYFARTKKNLRHVKRLWILWSLFGNLLTFIWAREGALIKASLKAMVKIMSANNPYYKSSVEGGQVIEPGL
jgi:glycosyltransferase involved in cell wall biosynthesis